MKTFPQHQYTKNLSGEEPVELPEQKPEKPVHLSQEDIKSMEQFLAVHPGIQRKFQQYKELLSIVNEEVLKTLKK